MSKLTKTYSVRDPIYGMIELNALEWDVINSPPFQRLRRIRQLAWTDYVYPGAMHTRFEHSLGVCHVATKLFESIRQKDEDILRSDYGFKEGGFERQRQVIRLAALIHDLGHGPLSHAAEDCFPLDARTGERYTHEQYSAALLRYYVKDVIDNHPINKNNYNITYDDIASLFVGEPASAATVVWKELVSGQMDADRMDYLRRDSYHSGVSYGKFDLDRVVNTVCLCEADEGSGHVIGIEADGIHAVEGLLIARYMMFTQVYFHKTRVIYDFHYDHALKHLLAECGGTFPAPTESEIGDYLEWDDWRVLSAIKNAARENAHCHSIKDRDHYRLVYYTPECPTLEDITRFDQICRKMDGLEVVALDAKKSWYKFQKEEVRLRERIARKYVSVPLAERSPVVKGLQTVNQRRLYVKAFDRRAAEQRLEKMI